MADPTGSIEKASHIARRAPSGSRPRPGASRRRGAAMVETALVLPLFFLFVFGMFEMARLGMVAQLLADAAREGCRVAVITNRTQADVDAAVKAILDAGSIPASCKPVMTPSDIRTAKRGDRITLTLSVPFNDVSWLSPPRFLGFAPIKASATLSSERLY